MIHKIINFEKNITPQKIGEWDSINKRYSDLSLQTYLIETTLQGDSISSEYIPFINIFTGKIHKREDNSKRVLLYNFAIANTEPAGQRRRQIAIPKPSYDSLLYNLAKDIIPQWFISDKVNLQAGKGILYEYDKFTGEYKLLMVLALKNSYLWELRNNKEKPDYTKFVLFINNEFATEDKFSTVFKKLEKEYVVNAINKGIDVVYTNHIINRCYQHTFIKPKFKTVSEMMNHFDKLNDIVHHEIKIED